MAVIFLIENLNGRFFLKKDKQSNFATRKVSAYMQNHKRFGRAVLEI